MTPLLQPTPQFVAETATEGDAASSDDEESGGRTPPEPHRGVGNLTAGMPTPASIRRQKKLHASSLEKQLKQAADMLGVSFKQQVNALHSASNTQRHDYNLKLEDMVKQQERLLDQQYEHQKRALQQIAARQQEELNRQAEAYVQALQHRQPTPAGNYAGAGCGTMSVPASAAQLPGFHNGTVKLGSGSCPPGASLVASLRRPPLGMKGHSTPPLPGPAAVIATPAAAVAWCDGSAEIAAKTLSRPPVLCRCPSPHRAARVGPCVQTAHTSAGRQLTPRTSQAQYVNAYPVQQALTQPTSDVMRMQSGAATPLARSLPGSMSLPLGRTAISVSAPSAVPKQTPFVAVSGGKRPVLCCNTPPAPPAALPPWLPPGGPCLGAEVGPSPTPPTPPPLLSATAIARCRAQALPVNALQGQ